LKVGEKNIKVESFFCSKKKVWIVGYPVSWAPCCKTWLKFEIAEIKVTIAEEI